MAHGKRSRKGKKSDRKSGARAQQRAAAATHARRAKEQRAATKPWLFQPGPDPRRGRGPKKGAPNAGRPRNEFKQEMRALASDEAVLTRLRQLLWQCTDPTTFIRALAFTTEHGYGKATQPIAAVRDDAADLEELRHLSDEELVKYFNDLRTKPAA